jgi:hypothetical protein
VRNLDNILTVHFMAETGYTEAGMANLVRTFTEKYLQTVSDDYVAVITKWLTAIGAYSNLYRIEQTVDNKVQVWMYSIGGWISSDAIDPSDRKAMVALKQYILSKTGFLHGQKDTVYPIDEAWFATTDLHFVAYVTDVDDLRQYPADMFRDGYVWLSAETAYLSVNQRVTSYNRQSADERDQLLRDWQKTAKSAAPAPVTVKAPAIIADFGTPEALAILAQDAPLYNSLESIRTHLLPPEAQIAVQRTDDANVLCVYVNGMPYNLNVHGVVTPEVIEHCERSFAMRTLSLDTLPTSVFHTVFAQDADHVNADAYVSGYGATMVVTPYIITLHDLNGRRQDFTREDAGQRVGFITEFYSALSRMYPSAAVDLAHYLLHALQPAFMYSVVQQGSHGEQLVVSSADEPRQFSDVAFPTSAFADIAAWVARLGKDDAVDAERESFDVEKPLSEGLNESAAALRETFEVGELAERGQLRSFQAVDELGILPETKEPLRAGLNLTLDVPKLDLQGSLKEALKPLQETIPGKLKAVSDALSGKSAAIEDRPGAERSVEVSVVDPAGQHVYTAEFVFANPEQRDSALERGFLPLVATQLGIKSYAGNLVATPRIGQLPSIACAVMETLGLAPEVTYRRLR